jgi:hypothetical protein
MKNKNYHVVPNTDGGWDVKKENSKRASSHHETQDQAVEAGKNLAHKTNGELVIHRPNGQIRDKDSYGNDPCPPKDTKH